MMNGWKNGWMEAGDYTCGSVYFSKSVFVVHLWQNVYSRNIELMKKASSCIDFSSFFFKGSGQSLVLIASPLAKQELTRTHACVHVYAM